MLPRPPVSRLFPYTTLFRSLQHGFDSRPTSKPQQDLAARTHERNGRVSLPRRDGPDDVDARDNRQGDRKSTRLNSSHGYISYAVFCLKKLKLKNQPFLCVSR